MYAGTLVRLSEVNADGELEFRGPYQAGEPCTGIFGGQGPQDQAFKGHCHTYNLEQGGGGTLVFVLLLFLNKKSPFLSGDGGKNNNT